MEGRIELALAAWKAAKPYARVAAISAGCGALGGFLLACLLWG